MSNSFHKLITESPSDCKSILFNGRLIKAGENRNYKTALFLNNDKILGDKRRSYVQFDCKSFTNNEVTFSIWVAPKKQSNANSIIISNETSDGITSLVYNSNGLDNQLGVTWNEITSDSPTDIDVKLESDVWTHLVIIFNTNGIVKAFKNGTYVSKTDLGIQTDNVHFSNIKVGGFCGWVDDFNLYRKPLDYGDVTLNETASNNVAYLFNISRITGKFETPYRASENKDNFYYMQTEDYVEAHKNYELQKQYNQKYYEDESKYKIDKGENSGKLRIADGSFRTFPGKIITNSV